MGQNTLQYHQQNRSKWCIYRRDKYIEISTAGLSPHHAVIHRSWRAVYWTKWVRLFGMFNIHINHSGSYWYIHVFDLVVWPCLEMTFYQCLHGSFSCHWRSKWHRTAIVVIIWVIMYPPIRDWPRLTMFQMSMLPCVTMSHEISPDVLWVEPNTNMVRHHGDSNLLVDLSTWIASRWHWVLAKKTFWGSFNYIGIIFINHGLLRYVHGNVTYIRTQLHSNSQVNSGYRNSVLKIGKCVVIQWGNCQ